MASLVRQITSDEVDAFAQLVSAAYPGALSSATDLAQRFRREIIEEPENPHMGLFRNGQLMGAMRIYHFTMHLHSVDVPVAGLGMVAVDLLHKKEHVAKDLVQHFLQHSRQSGAVLSALYPFRPDFYRQMGFGYGTQKYQLRLRPDTLPRTGAREHLVMLGPEDAVALLECYQRHARRTHGLMQRNILWAQKLFETPANRVLAYRVDGQIAGYAIFQVRTGKQFLLNDLEVRELIFDHPEALHAILAFLHSQRDQFGTVIVNTHEELFYFLPHDPRNGSDNLIPPVHHECFTGGLGLMYRICDLERYFAALAAHRFPSERCVLRIVARDGFIQPETTITLAFADGRVRIQPEAHPDTTITLSLADLSALLMGCANLRDLLRLGLAEISDPAYSGVVDRLLRAETRPVCFTAF